MQELSDILPPQWALWLSVIAQASFALSLIAAACKPLLGPPDPARDPTWKQWIFSLLRVVDFVAVNTTTIRAKDAQRKLLASRDKEEIGETERQRLRGLSPVEAADESVTIALIQNIDALASAELLAGMDAQAVEAQRMARRLRVLDMTPEQRRLERADSVAAQLRSKVHRGTTIAVVLLAVLSSSAASCVSGCAGSTSQVGTQAAIVKSAEEPFLAAKQALESRMATDYQGVKDRVVDAEAERVELLALEQSYGALEAAFETLRLAYNAYVEGIQAAHREGRDVSRELALALLSRWQSFVDVARSRGLAVPEPPSFLSDPGGAS